MINQVNACNEVTQKYKNKNYVKNKQIEMMKRALENNPEKKSVFSYLDCYCNFFAFPENYLLTLEVTHIGAV